MARVNFTADRVRRFTAEGEGKRQAFLWDAGAPGLGLRVTGTGARAYVFQTKLAGQVVRMTIGDSDTWSIPKARTEANRLRQIVDAGRDPRIDKAATVSAEKAERKAAKVERERATITGLDAWVTYAAARRSRWGERTQADHVSIATAGGTPRKHGAGMLRPGILHSLLAQPLATIDADVVAAWALREARKRPTQAQLASRYLSAFLRWCTEQPAYRGLAHADAVRVRTTRETLGRPRAKRDALQREQLAPWFKAVRALPLVTSAYLQGLLLTGARPNELRMLKWPDVDLTWHTLRLTDKVDREAGRVIPLPAYLAALLAELPRRGAYVFAGERATVIAPHEPHWRACDAAGIERVTLHGLRRSFGSLAEWVDVPTGVVAQLMGHKPSATAEKHYRVRPLDLLRLHHERITTFVLTEAGIAQPEAPEQKRLRLVRPS